jgi:iron complex outermembrane receptor protein
MVNVVTKQPLDHFYVSTEAALGSWRHERIAADITGPANESKTLLYRINAAEEHSDSWQWNASNRSISLSPVVEWRATPDTRASLEGEFRRETNNGAGAVVPVDPASGSFLAVPMPFTPLQGGSTVDVSRIYFHLDQNIGKEWTTSLKLLHTQSVVPVDLNTYLSQVHIPAVGPTNLTVDISTSLSNSINRTDAGMVDVVGHIVIGSTQHTVLLGGDYYHTPISSPSLGGSCCYTTNFYRPTALPATAALAANGSNGYFYSGENDQSSRDYGLYLQDQVRLPGQVHVLAGVRYQHYAETSDSSSAIGAPLISGTPAQDHLFTPRFGLLWRARDWLSLYYSYTQNFGINNGFAYPHLPLPPENARQNEIGAKTEFNGGRLVSTLALYNLTKSNVLAADPLHINYAIAIGAIRSRGFEYDLQGGLTRDWNIIANASYVQPITLIGNNSYPAGQRTSGVAEHTFGLWTTYKLTGAALPGVKLGAGADWRSSTAPYYNPTPGNNPTALSTPAYWTASLMAAYERSLEGYKEALQFNVNNALNRSYFNGLYPVLSSNFTFLYYGAPREYRLSVRVEF